MRSARDVLSRIIWDDSIDLNCFSIGWVDRFLGPKEGPLTEFAFESIEESRVEFIW